MLATNLAPHTAASSMVDTVALIAVAVALVVVAALMVLRMRAENRREAAARRDRSGLARAYAELSAAKAAAEARSAQLEATLSGMSDGVMMLDGESRLVQWNDRFPELTGVPRAMLRVGVTMADMIRAQALAGEFQTADPEAEVARRVAVIAAGRQHMMAERTRPDGRVVELRRNPLPSGGSVTLYTDITARRRAETAQRAIDAAAAGLVEQKAQFVAMVCHEVTTPLDMVLDCLRDLERHLPPAGCDDAPQAALRRARLAADTMAELMRDILDMAQLDAGRLALRPADYALAPVLDRVMDDFAARAAARGMRLVVEIAPGLPQRLHGDGGRVRQVLANFVSNAVKYSDSGQITLRASRLDLGAPMLRLAVADPGPRVPPAHAALLFQPFARLPAAGREGDAAPPSVGLGLAICERLARIMGGEVGLVAGAAGGNEFWITVPLQPARLPPPPLPDPAPASAVPPAHAAVAPRSPPTAPPVAAAPISRPRRHRAMVLLVEDLLVNQVVTATKLRRDGHHVALASSGAEAVRRAAHHPYDVVFMDLMMPGMSGYEAARAIRALPGPASVVPIFALTATTAPDDRARCLAAGMQGMLSKPVDAAALAEALSHGPAAAASTAAPAAPAGAAAPRPGLLIDAARLEALRSGLPPGLFTELATQCIGDLHDHMATLHTALRTGAANAVEASAHAIAGMAGNYGLQAIDSRMRRIMAAARLADLDAARAAAEGGEAELDRTEQALDLLLQLHDG